MRLRCERLEHRDTPSAPDWGVPVDHTFGDFNDDGSQDVAYVAGAGGSVRVRIETLDRENAPPGVYFDGVVFDPAFRGGGVVTAAGGGAGGPDRLVVAPGPGGGPVLGVFALGGDGLSLGYAKAAPYPDEFRGGLRLSTADVDRDGSDEILTLPGEGGGPHLVALDAATLAVEASFMAGDPADRTGGYFFSPTGGGVTFPGGLWGVALDTPGGARGWTWAGRPVDRVVL